MAKNVPKSAGSVGNDSILSKLGYYRNGVLYMNKIIWRINYD